MIKSYASRGLTSISITVIDFCQLKCEYCFQYSKTSSFLTKNKLDIILNQLRKIDQKMEIIIMGGEPTLHPHLNYMLDELNKIENVKEILIFTNGIKLLDKIHFNSKVRLTFSYHYTQNNKNNIINNLKYLNKVNPPIYYDVNIMMVPNKKIDVSEFKKFCKVKPLYIETKHGTIYCNSCDELFNLKEVDYDGEQLTYTEYMKKSHNYKGRRCFINEYTIELNLNSVNTCLKENIQIEHFAEYVNKYPFILCPFEKCKKTRCGSLNIE